MAGALQLPISYSVLHPQCPLSSPRAPLPRWASVGPVVWALGLISAPRAPCSVLRHCRPPPQCASLLPTRSRAWALCPPTGRLCPPDLSCLMRPLLALGSTGRKSLNQVISGSGFPLAAQSMVAVRVRSTTFSWGPMSMLGKPGGSWSSGGVETGRKWDRNMVIAGNALGVHSPSPPPSMAHAPGTSWRLWAEREYRRPG